MTIISKVSDEELIERRYRNEYIAGIGLDSASTLAGQGNDCNSAFETSSQSDLIWLSWLVSSDSHFNVY